MKRIYLSILAIVATVALVGGATYAVFTNAATSGPNTFATGNADLKLRHRLDQDWADSYGGANWGNLYPGWSDSYNVYLKNVSSSPITLRVLPKVNITSWSTGHLWDKVLMEITWSDGNNSTGEFSLRAWRENASIYLVPTLAQGAEAGPWVVKFRIPTTASNEISNGSIVFDVIFDGIQVTP
ncbi:MAG: SipW-dependent-type signal peptide-containing protein [Microgenomates group bacterium]